MPVTALSDAAPIYERPFTERAPLTGDAGLRQDPSRCWRRCKTILASPDMASRRWVWEQYDHTVMADTVQRARRRRRRGAGAWHQQGAGHHHRCDAALLPRRSVRRRQAGGGRSLAQSDRCGRDCRWPSPTISITAIRKSPRSCGRSWPASTASAKPAARSTFPVIGGNCSLYNETNGEGILPTPAIGGVGLMKDVTKMATVAFKRARRCRHPDRRNQGPSRPVHLSARDRRPGRRCGAARRSGRGKEARRFRARADRSGPRRHRA